MQINRSVEARRFQAILIHGVTGSGKTAVYLAAMRQVLKSGRGSILLVPEIGLTPRGRRRSVRYLRRRGCHPALVALR